MMPSQRAVAVGYRRVSTADQGKSGLGLEDQDRAINTFCAARGLTLNRTFTEVESGKNDARPQLAEALALARRLRGSLVIAKLDRLGRDVHFISGLMKSDVPFNACDCPDDEPFILHVKASFAEEEARKISQRTKAALAVLKSQGVKLGKPENLKNEHRAAGRAKIAATHAAERAALRPRALELSAARRSSHRIAAELGISAPTVRRILRGE